MTIRKNGFDFAKNELKRRLSVKQRALWKKRVARHLAILYSSNLCRLAQIYGSDKWGDHSYCPHYQRHFDPLRKKAITLLEIGIGGCDDPYEGGASLRLWKRYFSRGRIYGIDITDKSPHNENRIHTFKGDQSDENFLRRVIDEIGAPDIIVDDGSHFNKHVLKTFEVLFPLLGDNGIYVIEDTQTSYWPPFGGTSENLDDAPTSMCMLKKLVDGLNHAEYIRPGFIPSYYDKHIVAVHFYHNLVFVEKGLNDEGSNKGQYLPGVVLSA